MGISLYRIHVEYGSESRRKLRYQPHQVLVSYILQLTCHFSLHPPYRIQVFRHLERILAPEFHQDSINKDLSGPAFKGTFSLVAVKPREQCYETFLEHVLGKVTVSDIAYAQRKHMRCQTVIKDLLRRSVSLSARFNQL